MKITLEADDTLGDYVINKLEDIYRSDGVIELIVGYRRIKLTFSGTFEKQKKNYGRTSVKATLQS